MKNIQIGRVWTEIPTSWEEMTEDQYFTYMLLLSAVMSDEMQRLEAEKYFFSFLIGWNGADWTRMADIDTADQLRTIFLEERKWWGMENLPDTGCINLMPMWRGHKGPRDWFDDVKWGVFTDCLDLMTIIAKEQTREYVEALASLLYSLPKDERPDRVLQYHCISLVRSLLTAISSGPVSINGQEVDLSIIFGNGDGKEDGTGMTGVSFAVAESGVFGDYANVRQTGMWEVLLYLYKCKKSKDKEKKS